MEKKRDYNIDMVKAIAVILVVLGHIIQYICVRDGYWENHVFRYIYSFHMPLFMFISGYLSFRPDKELDFEWLKQRAIRLMIPFLVWIVPLYMYNKVYTVQSIGSFLGGIMKSPDAGGLWFFEVLFLNSICLFLAEKIKVCLKARVKKMADICCSLFSKGIVYIAVCIITLAGFDYFGVNLCSWHLIFYFAGNILAMVKCMSIWEKTVVLRILWKWMSLLGFPAVGFFWRQSELPALVSFFGIIGRMGWQLLVPFLGIGFIWNLVPYISDGIKKKFAVLSRCSGEIYILQFFFIRQYCDVVVIDALIAFLASIFLSLAIAKLVESPKVPSKLSLVLFGK